MWTIIIISLMFIAIMISLLPFYYSMIFEHKQWSVMKDVLNEIESFRVESILYCKSYNVCLFVNEKYMIITDINIYDMKSKRVESISVFDKKTDECIAVSLYENPVTCKKIYKRLKEKYEMHIMTKKLRGIMLDMDNDKNIPMI